MDKIGQFAGFSVTVPEHLLLRVGPELVPLLSVGVAQAQRHCLLLPVHLEHIGFGTKILFSIFREETKFSFRENFPLSDIAFCCRYLI
jgi:hypothetical protein